VVNENDELIRKRQRERARVMAILLAAFVVLMFFITIAKTGMNW
jgi:cytochrome c oxidase assembly protein Cox11